MKNSLTRSLLLPLALLIATASFPANAEKLEIWCYARDDDSNYYLSDVVEIDTDIKYNFNFPPGLGDGFVDAFVETGNSYNDVTDTKWPSLYDFARGIFVPYIIANHGFPTHSDSPYWSRSSYGYELGIWVECYDDAKRPRRDWDDDADGKTAIHGSWEELAMASPPSLDSAQGQLELSIVDACRDGRDIEYRIFGFRDDSPGSSKHIGVAPGSDQVFVAQDNGVEVTSRHNCKVDTGETVRSWCYGAKDPDGFWGVGIDGEEACQGCCTSCPETGTSSRSIQLTCDNLRSP